MRCGMGTEKERIEPSDSKKRKISDPAPAQISDIPQSGEESSINKIKLVKPDLSKIAQSRKVIKKKKF